MTIQGGPPPLKYAQEAAQALAVRLESLEVKTANPDFDGAFRPWSRSASAASYQRRLSQHNAHRKKILELLEQTRIPAIYGSNQLC